MTAQFDKYQAMGAYHWRECDRGSREFNPPLVARFEMIARRVTGGSVLDVGAGDGYLSGLVAPKCEKLAALEHDEAGVSIARQMLLAFGNVRVCRGSAYALPFTESQFDVVMMADVIEHLEHPEGAVEEMARVLKPEGTTYVSTPRKVPDRVWDHRHVKEYRPEEFEELLGGAFAEVRLVFAWPKMWMDLYRTRLGWRLLKAAGRLGFNPFARESDRPDTACQMLAICRQPRTRKTGAD
jgi:SAM-dependent methyltransferase